MRWGMMWRATGTRPNRVDFFAMKVFRGGFAEGGLHKGEYRKVVVARELLEKDNESM